MHTYLDLRVGDLDPGFVAVLRRETSGSERYCLPPMTWGKGWRGEDQALFAFLISLTSSGTA